MRRTHFSMLRTFSLGTLITFGCAVLYSVHGPRASIRAASNSEFKKLEAGRREKQSSSSESAEDEQREITQPATSPARNLPADPTTPGPEQSGGEPLRSELSHPETRAVS